MKYNGKWFPGWGYMRFWEFERAACAPSHTYMTGTDGDGDMAEPAGAIVPQSWRFPTRSTLIFLSAIPRGVHH